MKRKLKTFTEFAKISIKIHFLRTLLGNNGVTCCVCLNTSTQEDMSILVSSIMSKLRDVDVLSFVMGATIFRRHNLEKPAEYQSYHLLAEKLLLEKLSFDFYGNSVNPPDSVKCKKQNLVARFPFTNALKYYEIIEIAGNC